MATCSDSHIDNSKNEEKVIFLGSTLTLSADIRDTAVSLMSAKL